MTDSLVDYNQQGELDPTISLAEAWEVVDGTKIIFTVRDGVKFHNGEALTADIVRANFERILDPNTSSVIHGQMAAIQDIEVTDDRTISVQLDGPNAAFLTNLGDRAGRVMPMAYLENPIEDQMVGTGPFRLDRWDRDSMVRFVKNEDYWRPDAAGNPFPYMDAIELLTIPDRSVAEANFKSGSVDLFEPLLARLSEYESDNSVQVREYNGWNTRMWWTNTATAPTDDIRFRKAMAHALDREGENQALHFGRYTVDERPGPFPPGYSNIYTGDVPTAANYDPAEARKFLEASGYADNASVEHVSATGAENDQRYALYEDNLAQVGIRMVHQVGNDASPFYTAHTVPTRISIFRLRADPDGWASESWLSEAFFNPGANSSPEFSEIDGLVIAARSTYDPEERAEMYRNMAAVISDLSPQIHGPYATSYRVASERVQNFETIFGFEAWDRYTNLWLSS